MPPSPSSPAAPLGLICTTVYLAAAERSTDPWQVLGNTYATRLALAALSDLALARRLAVAPGAQDDGPGARLLEVLPGMAPDAPLTAALTAMASTSKRRDVDRVVRLLGELSPAIESALVAAGGFVVRGEKGLLRKRPVLAAVPEARAAAQARLRAASHGAGAADRALTLIAAVGLSRARLARLCGGELASRHDPFEPFDPASRAPDGRPLGANAAELLSVLVLELAGTHDTTNDYDD